MNIKKLYIALLFLLPYSLHAHSPDVSSTILINQGPQEWVLQVRAALTAFETVIEKVYGPDAYATPEEFQDLVLQHVKKNMNIYFNDTLPLSFHNGKVKLGHETSVTFELNGAPASLKNLGIKNSSFREIGRNKSSLVILKKDFDKNKFILDRTNDYYAKIKVVDNYFNLVKQGQTCTSAVSENRQIILGATFAATITLVFLVLFLQRKAIDTNKEAL